MQVSILAQGQTLSSLRHPKPQTPVYLMLDTFDIYKQNIKVVGIRRILQNFRQGFAATFSSVSALDFFRTMSFSVNFKGSIVSSFIVVAFLFASGLGVRQTIAGSSALRSGGLGVIKGVVRDQTGSAIADATVAIFRVGTARLLKEVRSASDGSFLTRVLPGTYTIMAVAEGYNAVTVASVDVTGSAELVYGFKLVRAGSGNTLPEKTIDKNSSKWKIRSATLQQTIYQHTDGKTPADDNTAGKADASLEVDRADDASTRRHSQTAVESYFAGSKNGNYSGINFATLIPLTENAEIVLAGQASTGHDGPARFESQFKLRANGRHTVRTNLAVSRLAAIDEARRSHPLGQFSAQALDEWTVHPGII